jgi:carbon storage regulator
MLVVARKVSERILIGDDIWIMIVDIRGDQVRIGVEAPKHLSVDREEVAIQKIVAKCETVADLEICGLPLRLINALEKMGCIYIRDLKQISEATILAQPMLGKKAVAKIRQALQNFCDRRAVKTIGDILSDAKSRSD